MYSMGVNVTEAIMLIVMLMKANITSLIYLIIFW